MRLVLRPSKAFLFDALERTLEPERTGVGIDAAAGTMKNRPFFKTERYVGVDMDLPSLEAGLRAFPEPTVVGLLGDLTSLEGFPAGVGTVVVSTSTIHRIDQAKRLGVVDRLARMTSPVGLLFCSMPRDAATHAIEERLRASFASVEAVYYQNPFSRAYERVFELKALAHHYRQPLSSPPLKFMSWCLARLEFVSSRWKVGNGGVYFVCRHRRSNEVEPFSLDRFPLIGDRLRDAGAAPSGAGR